MKTMKMLLNLGPLGSDYPTYIHVGYPGLPRVTQCPHSGLLWACTGSLWFTQCLIYIYIRYSIECLTGTGCHSDAMMYR